MRKSLAYDDVLLVPQYSDIQSRGEIDITRDMGKGFTLQTPILASPMDTISETEMAKAMLSLGAAAVVHRYNSLDAQVEMIATAARQKHPDAAIGAAIGVSGDYLDRAVAAAYAGATFLCVDVAHGHHILMKEALGYLRIAVGEDIHIMAGNVATLAGLNDLSDWGADSVRCNIGGGCFTAGTLVRGPDGDTPIEKVKIGDKVFSHTGEVREVIDTLTFDRDEEIMVINGIRSTKNHEYYVVDVENAEKVNDNNLDTFAYWLEAEHLDMDKHLLVEIQ